MICLIQLNHNFKLKHSIDFNSHKSGNRDRKFQFMLFSLVKIIPISFIWLSMFHIDVSQLDAIKEHVNAQSFNFFCSQQRWKFHSEKNLDNPSILFALTCFFIPSLKFIPYTKHYAIYPSWISRLFLQHNHYGYE